MAYQCNFGNFAIFVTFFTMTTTPLSKSSSNNCHTWLVSLFSSTLFLQQLSYLACFFLFFHLIPPTIVILGLFLSFSPPYSSKDCHTWLCLVSSFFPPLFLLCFSSLAGLFRFSPPGWNSAPFSCLSKQKKAQWFRTAKNQDVSTGLFAHTAHLLARSAALTHLLACSLTPELVGK